MIRLRHVLHPFRSARSLYLRLRARIAARKFRKIRRGQRENCWCGGELRQFTWHERYGVCASCGCYVNRRPPLAEELQRLYGFKLYWHTRARLKGHPMIEHRTANDRSDGRLQYWLSLIERYGPRAGQVVEVGCSHGVLLAELRTRGYECVGVEPDPQTAAWTTQNTDVEVRTGFFPDVEVPACDLFLAFDVIEHSTNPLAFLCGASAVLRPGGVAIIQTPIDRYDFTPPFGERFKDAFDDLEHLFLFTDRAMGRLACLAGLETLNTSERLWLHHEVCVFRKQTSSPNAEPTRI